MRKIVPKDTWNKEIRRVPNEQINLEEITRDCRRLRKPPKTKTWKEAIRNWKQDKWKEIWESYQSSIAPRKIKAPAQRVTSNYYPKIHVGISKATSSLITQIRTEKIGLNAFLAERRVPNRILKYSYGYL